MEPWLKAFLLSFFIEELRKEINVLKAYTKERNSVYQMRKTRGYVASTNCEAAYLEFNSSYIANSGCGFGQNFE